MSRAYWLAASVLVVAIAGCTPSTPQSSEVLPEEVQEAAQSAQSLPSSQAAPSTQSPVEIDEVVLAVAPEPPPATPTAEEVTERFAGLTPSEWGLEIPGVLTRMDSDGVALTLDACGGPSGDGYDAALIDGLIERNVPATLFLNMRWIDSNPELAAELANNPLFEIGNHGATHRPLSVNGQSAYGIVGTGSALDAAHEVLDNHLRILELTGKAPRFFRSGTAHYDDVGIQIAQALDEEVLGFSVNGDAGATFDAATVRAQVAGAPPGSIVIAHMNQPGSGTAEGLLAGVDDLLFRGIRLTLVENPW